MIPRIARPTAAAGLAAAALAALAAVAALAAGPASAAPSCKTVPQPKPRDGGGMKAPKKLLDPRKTYDVVVDTTCGSFTIRLDVKRAPRISASFVSLVRAKFYDRTIFHRIVPGFVIQGGDPKGNGTGDAGTTIPLEIAPNLRHDGPGVVAMARSQAPNSASCQFYITLGAAPHLDGGYAVFGKVIEGQKVVDQIVVGDKMDTVTVAAAEAQK